MSLGGLIAGALGGAAKGYTQFAESELKKNQELDLRKQLMEAETEKQLRIDEIKRERDIRDIGPRSDAEAAAYARTAPVKARADADAAPIRAAGDAAAAPIRAAGDAAAAPIRAAGDAAAQVAKTGTAGYLGSVSQEAAAKEGPSAKASAAATTDRNRREQSEFERLDKARKATAEYQDAVDRGDDAAAKVARRKGIELGVDPAGVKKGALKVTEDENGQKVLVHEDDKGNVTRVDTGTLEPYKPRGTVKPAGKVSEADAHAQAKAAIAAGANKAAVNARLTQNGFKPLP